MDIEDVKESLINDLDITFEQRVSDYLGMYYKYTGLFADRISVFKNTEELLEFDDKYAVIIDISITQGREKDKKSKYSYLKKAFGKKSNIYLLIKDRSAGSHLA